MATNSITAETQNHSQLRSTSVLFDLDGTLTDPKLGITRSIQFALERLGADVPSIDDLTWCIGPPLLENFQQLLDAERAPSAVVHYRERFASVGLFENKPYAGIHDVLSQLQSQDLRLFVASSKPEIYVRQILEHFELIEFFEGVFGSELDGTRSNKSELLRFAVSEAKIDPSRATMVGDRKHDMIGAADNSIATIGVLYGYGSLEELTEAGADRLAKATDELVPLLAR
jgi:phosphoglycolate phosphatase